MDRVRQKVAIVTGAAGGIGLATATLLAREGAKVVLTDIHGDRAHAAAAQLQSESLSVQYLEQDIADEKSWPQVFERAETTYGPVTILVNNAGIGHFGGIADVTVEALHRVMSVNVDGTFWGVREAVRRMRLHGRGGSIVNVSSLGGIVGDPGGSIYNASKAAIHLLTKCVALECARRGDKIRVNSVHPGLIMTDMASTMIAEATGRPVQDALTLFKQIIPVGYPGTPLDVANAILYLASDESAYVIGSELVVDGGWNA